MMNLEEAWDWYRTNRRQLELFGRLGRKHWEQLPWEGSLGKDEKLRAVNSDMISQGATFCLDHLEDFAVLILFSVFESMVRARVLSEVEEEQTRLGHPLVVRIIDDAVDDIENGSFFRVLEVFKGRDPGLIEEVNQVRRYRNWVAHGRRTAKPDAVDPETAFRRLKRFLDELIGPLP